MIQYLEKKLGRFAVPNVTQFLIVIQVGMFAVVITQPAFMLRAALIPSRVLDGEVYRLLSFLAEPPSTSPLWAFFAWYLFFLMGTTLENHWGAFRYNLFLLIGFVATVAAAFLTPDIPAGNLFIKGSVFLAFAHLNPDFQLNLFFILPIKIKWLALLTWIGVALTILTGNLNTQLAAVASVLNFLVFFGRDLIWRIRSGNRQMTGYVQRAKVKAPAFYHKCATCGLTDVDDRNMDFRYCGQCSGDQAYCEAHLRSHEHVRDEP